MTLYNTIQRYTRLSKLRHYTRVHMTDYTTLHNVMQHYRTTLYKAIRYYTMLKNSLIIQEQNTKKNHKRVVVLYVIKNHVNLHKI